MSRPCLRQAKLKTIILKLINVSLFIASLLVCKHQAVMDGLVSRHADNAGEEPPEETMREGAPIPTNVYNAVPPAPAVGRPSIPSAHPTVPQYYK